MSFRTNSRRLDIASNLTIATAAPAVPSPIVILLHEAYGLNAHSDDLVAHVASHGFFAVAPDLFGGRAFEYSDSAGAMAAVRQCSDTESIDTIKTTIQWARAQGAGANQPVGVLGFCMGGRLAFIAACALGAAIDAAVCCYGGGIGAEGERDRFGRSVPLVENNIKQLSAPLMFIYGNQDAHIPPAEHARIVQMLGAQQKPFVLESYPAGHGFLSDRPEYYNPACARAAWQQIFSHLLRHMGLADPALRTADYQ